MNAVQKTLKDLFTEDDNESADLMPVLVMLAWVAGTFLEVWVVVVIKTQPFNPVEYGAFCGTMVTTLGLAFKLKRDAQTKPMAETPAPTEKVA